MALSDLDSVARRLILQEAGGALFRFFSVQVASVTAATVTSGGVTTIRVPRTFTVPALSGYTGWELDADITLEDAGRLCLAALEYDLGTLTVSTNTFSAGVSMPTTDTRISGATYSAVQTASLLTFATVMTNVTGTAPVLTVTYVNQDGTGSRTATLTLPSNPLAGSSFDVTPHLQTGDTAIRSVSNVSISTGSAGEIRLKGLLPIAVSATGVANAGACFRSLHKVFPPFLATGGEVVAFYLLMGSPAASELTAVIYGRPI